MHIQLKLNINISGVQGLLSSHRKSTDLGDQVFPLKTRELFNLHFFLFPSLSTFTENGRVLVGYIITKNALSTISGVDHHQE